ncbi:alpha/beta hydrolase family protein [Plantactinospora soyae]|uniref:Dienelactone hydrolase n=1 Tax=Plantactinospora soyae TaxID=1544732 RepID=A0A927M2L5_9ACTN|nr:prolyl oligopeptidase family serine peptidase [Plantactinospora soyae]MBE1486484.1 dienelactone hydrolase [Plantactinospora soyae]
MRRSLVGLLGCSLAAASALIGTPMPASAEPNGLPAGLTAAEVTFRSGDLTLHGTVLAPRAAGPRRPGMVLVHGSGVGVSREKLRREAEAFAAGGIVTLIYDKRAADYSPVHRDYSLLADDALAGLAMLRTRSEVDPANVGLWGFSEGGWVAPMAAARSSAVAFLVVVGANGVPPARQEAWAMGERQRHQGISGSSQDRFPTTGIRLVAGADLFAQAHHDPVPVLERVRQPVLAIWGGKDRQTPPGEGLTVYHQVLARTGNPHYMLRVFPNGDHAVHQSTDDGFRRLDDLMPGYADLVTSWVADVVADRPPERHVDPVPRQDRPSPVIHPLAWWESPGLQLAAILLCTLAFLAYPMVALGRRLRRGRGSLAGLAPARWLAGLGLAAMLGFLWVFVASNAGASLGPVVAGRALSWLVVQLLAVAVVAAAVATVIGWVRARAVTPGRDRLRLGLLLTGALVFLPWAAYWGLLLP